MKITNMKNFEKACNRLGWNAEATQKEIELKMCEQGTDTESYFGIGIDGIIFSFETIMQSRWLIDEDGELVQELAPLGVKFITTY